MSEATNVVSAWTRQVQNGQKPSGSDLLDHLAVVHEDNAGFTETCAWNCRDTNGKNSYELLTDIIDTTSHFDILDLGCGSGVLLDLCNQRFSSDIRFTGVDISKAELKLARSRLAHTDTRIFQGLAQNLDFLNDSSIDVILCHWALTLMDPIIPVLNSIKRVLKNGGIFSAIIDGNGETAHGYNAVNNIIYKYVRKKYPKYGVLELGDNRIRTAEGVKNLIEQIFCNCKFDITPTLLRYDAKPVVLARETAKFFYASFVIPPDLYKNMLTELEEHFASNQKNGVGCFFMPINHLTIYQN